MDTSIKNKFIENYKKILNEQANDILYFIREGKIDLNVDFEDLFILDSDEVLADVNEKLEKTKEAIKAYNDSFNEFKDISKEVKDFLTNYGKNLLWPNYQKIKDLIDQEALNAIFKHLDNNSEIFQNEYSIQNFDSKIKDFKTNLSYYIKYIDQSLKDYGAIEEEYSKNLESEIENYTRLRRLEEDKNDHHIDVKIDNAFTDLKEQSVFMKTFLETLNLYFIFDEKIENYKNKLNEKVKYSEYVLNNTKKENDNYDIMWSRLKQLQDYSENYYLETNKSYYKMKELIYNEIFNINELIEKCANITYDTIANKYIQYKNEFSPINMFYQTTKDEIPIKNYISEDNSTEAKTSIEKYLIDNKISLDIIFEEEGYKKPKVIGKIINEIKPKTFLIDYFHNIGQRYGKIGKELHFHFNNITSITTIYFDSALNNAIINTNFNFSEYTINYKYYTKKEKKIQRRGYYIVEEDGIKNYTDTFPETIHAKNKNKQEECNF